MRKFYKLFLLSVLSTLSICASAHDFEVDEIYYKITSASGQTVSVTYREDDYNDYSARYFGTVIIPETVDYDGITYKVTAIDEYAFYGCTQLTSVKISTNVTSIRTAAFRGCTGLKTVTMDNGVTSIQTEAFYGCSALSSITLSANLTRIGASAFYNCTALSAIKIPGKVNSIGEDAFFNSYISKVEYESLEQLLTLTFINTGSMPGNSQFGKQLYINGIEVKDIVIPTTVTEIGNSLFCGFMLNSVKIPSSVTSIGSGAFSGCTGLTSITIPSSVTSIGSSAFWGCTGLTSIAIPNSVTMIGRGAFQGCTGLTAITIPSSVTYIGDSAFSGCTGLTSLTIPNSVTEIYPGTFSGCTGLTSITIPNSVTSISGFSGCTGLTSITIPNSVTNIEDSAFSGCTGITSITIPSSVTYIGYGAFSGCTGITSITIPSSVTQTGGSVFQGCPDLIVILDSNTIASKDYSTKANLTNNFGSQVKEYIFGSNVKSIGAYAFSGCTGLTSITISNSVTSIGAHAFYGCTGLTSITIPNSVTSIGDYAFRGCTGLTKIKCLTQTPPSCSSTTFTDVPKSTCVLEVPEGSLAAYRAAAYWKNFTNIQEIAVDKENLLSMEGLGVYRNSQVVLPIAMQNESEIAGFQFDLYLPTGVTIATNSKGKALITTTERMEGNYVITSNEMGGCTRVVGYSPDGIAFTGTSGDFLDITLNIAKDMPTGDYTIQISDIVLSDNNNTEHKPADIEAILSVAPYTMADVDNDGNININDVVCLINHILNKENATFITEASDIDGNGTININDVVSLINLYILGNSNNAPAVEEISKAPQLAAMADNNYLYLADIDIQPGETKEIQMLMSNTDVVVAAQGNIKLPAGVSFVTKSNGRVDAKNIDDRSEDFSLSCAIQEDGSLTFAHYSADGYTYEGNSGGIFTFKIKADETAAAGNYNVELSDVVLSIGGVGYEIPGRTNMLTIGGSTGIDTMGTEDSALDLSNCKIFTLNGLQVNELQPGLNIVRMMNGAVKKYVVK